MTISDPTVALPSPVPALLAFDFDGTLAPIVPRPEWARVPDPLARLLGALARHRRVAIVTGRRIDDVRHRLGFVPWRIVGNHGAEWEDALEQNHALARALDDARSRVLGFAEELTYAGVAVEDKQQSIALHYRRAGNHPRARSIIERCLEGLDASSHHVFGGKCVVNIQPAQAHDKAHAVGALAREAKAGTVFYAGDDVNDEPVFAAAQPGWYTVRIGDAEGTRAARVLPRQDELAPLLQELLQELEAGRAPGP